MCPLCWLVVWEVHNYSGVRGMLTVMCFPRWEAAIGEGGLCVNHIVSCSGMEWKLVSESETKCQNAGGWGQNIGRQWEVTKSENYVKSPLWGLLGAVSKVAGCWLRPWAHQGRRGVYWLPYSSPRRSGCMSVDAANRRTFSAVFACTLSVISVEMRTSWSVELRIGGAAFTLNKKKNNKTAVRKKMQGEREREKEKKTRTRKLYFTRSARFRFSQKPNN